MNRLIANTLGFLNGLIALIIIAVGAISGYYQYESTQNALWLAGGPLIGLIIATVFCGVIAIFIDIRNILRDKLDQQGLSGSRVATKDRSEPTFN